MPMEFGASQLVLLLMTVAVIVGIPVAVLSLIFRLGQRSASVKPEEVLRSRFARGEITRDEFDAALRALGR